MNTNPFGILGANEPLKAGQIRLANEAAVNNQFLSDALTQYSVGWTSPGGVLEAILETLTGAPVIVPKRFSFKKADNAKAFAAVEADEDVRAIGADFKRVTVQGSTVDAHTVSKGLTIRVDRDHPFHSDGADRRSGKADEGLPQAPWVHPSNRNRNNRKRQKHKSFLGRRQPDFGQK